MYFRSFVCFSNLNLISIVGSYLNFLMGSAVQNVSQKNKTRQIENKFLFDVDAKLLFASPHLHNAMYMCVFCSLWSISLEKNWSSINLEENLWNLLSHGRDLGCYYLIISAQCHNAQSNIILYCHKIIKAHIVTPLLASSWLKVRAFNIFQLCVDHKYDADVFPTGLSSLESNIVSWRIRFENLPTGPIQSEGEKTEEQNKMWNISRGTER